MGAEAKRDEAGEDDESCSWKHNAEVRELLDHLALELAEEYLRLMEEAADKDKPRTLPCEGGVAL